MITHSKAGSAQITLCAAMGYLISTALGLSTSDGIWIGAAISLSSTMIVLKTLAARNALASKPGRIMLAILIAQDVALVPLLLLAPQLTSESVSLAPIVTAIGNSASFLAIMYLTGVYVFPRLFKVIARQGSRELFFLSTLTVAFGAGFLSHELGLSFALGAFVAGMLLSETDFNQQALSDVSTLRDLFALIFFVSVGMLFDPLFFVDRVWTILLLAAAVVLSKAIIISCTMRVFRYSRALSWTVGLGLAQVGEFAFVIAKAGQHSGNLSAESFSLMIAVTVVSMVATPAFFWIGEFISKGSQAEDPLETSNVIEHEVPIVVRVEEVEDIDTLSSLTVEEIVQPQLEVGLEMVRQSLLSLGIDEARVFTLLGQLRAERYEPMRHPNNRLLNDARFLTASKFLEFLWIEINDTSPLVNVSISGSGMRERFGLSVVAIIRNDEYFPTPKPDFTIFPGDALGIIGTRAQLRSLLEGNQGS